MEKALDGSGDLMYLILLWNQLGPMWGHCGRAVREVASVTAVGVVVVDDVVVTEVAVVAAVVAVVAKISVVVKVANSRRLAVATAVDRRWYSCVQYVILLLVEFYAKMHV